MTYIMRFNVADTCEIVFRQMWNNVAETFKIMLPAYARRRSPNVRWSSGGAAVMSAELQNERVM